MHLLDSYAGYGTYKLTNAGSPQSWANVAKQVFELTGHDPQRVTPASTVANFGAKAHAPRPSYIVLNLEKIQSVEWAPCTARVRIIDYLTTVPSKTRR